MIANMGMIPLLWLPLSSCLPQHLYQGKSWLQGRPPIPAGRAVQGFGQTVRGMGIEKDLEDYNPGRKIEVREPHWPCQMVEFSARPHLLESMQVPFIQAGWVILVYVLSRALPASWRTSVLVFWQKWRERCLQIWWSCFLNAKVC